MGQITIYLDEPTEKRLKASAKESGLSVSRWIANLIRERTALVWPREVAKLAGAWRDLPTAEELREDLPDDTAREPV